MKSRPNMNLPQAMPAGSIGAPDRYGRTLVVGLGSTHGDDRVGWLVVEQLRGRAPVAFGLRTASSPAQILDWLSGVSRLFVCDACRGAGQPGSISRWSWPTGELYRLRSASTHRLGLAEVLELATRLNRAPPEIAVWGIEIEDAQPMHGLSPAVTRAADVVAETIYRETIHA